MTENTGNVVRTVLSVNTLDYVIKLGFTAFVVVVIIVAAAYFIKTTRIEKVGLAGAEFDPEDEKPEETAGK